jgi:plastocyanin
MMGFGGVGYGGAWLWMLAGVLFVVGIVVLVVWAIGAAAGRPDEDEAIDLLRARFARGEIDATEFEQARQTLGTTRPSGGRSRTPAIVAIALIASALVVGLLAGALTPAGAGWSFGGMMGPGMMGGYGVAPTAPAGTSVRMAGSRFGPATITIAPGQTVRWFNDGTAPHTVTAIDGSWDSGDLSPGGSFERRFDKQGTYPYVCRYHPWMKGKVQVTAP